MRKSQGTQCPQNTAAVDEEGKYPSLKPRLLFARQCSAHIFS